MALRLHSRLIVLNGCAIVAVTLMLAYALGTSVRGAVEQEIQDQLYRSAALATDYARLHPDGDDPMRLARALSAALGVRVTVIAMDGTVLGDSELTSDDVRSIENHANRPEVIEALKNGKGASLRWSSTLRVPFIYVATAADERILRLAMPLSTMDLLLTGLRKQLVPLLLASIAITLIFGYMVYALVSRPLRRLAEAAQDLAVGNLDRDIPEVGDVDLARVGASLNAMARNLRMRMDELKEDRRQIAAIVEAMSAGVVVFDREATVVLANRAIRDLLELRGEPEGRTAMELIRHPAIEAAVRRSLGGEDVPAVEIATPGGRTLSARSTPVRLLSGLVERAVVVFHDLTEVRRTERMRRDFVANVSHEFKTPLTSIRGYAETLLNAPPQNVETTREFTEAIERNAELLTALVDDLLVLAQLEGERPLVRQPLDIRSLLEGQIGQRRRTLDEKGIAVTVDCPQVPVSADASRLERAVSNLIDNAIYYNRPQGRIDIVGRHANGEFSIDISDTGMGIAPEDLLRVFERFYRVEKSRARNSGGTGLGLAIVRHAVESMGGRITVSSKVGAGSTFTITLPVAEL